MDLLAQAVHRVLGQRLEVLPAAEPTQSTQPGVVYLDVAAIALAEHAALDMGRLQLAAHRQQRAAVVDERLCHVKAATVALAEAQRDVDPMVGRRRGDPVHLGTITRHRVLAVTGDELHTPGGRVEPDPPRIARQERLRERDELRATTGSLGDEVTTWSTPAAISSQRGSAWAAATRTCCDMSGLPENLGRGTDSLSSARAGNGLAIHARPLTSSACGAELSRCAPGFVPEDPVELALAGEPTRQRDRLKRP